MQTVSATDRKSMLSIKYDDAYWRGPSANDLDNDDKFWRVQDPCSTPIDLAALNAYKDLCKQTKADAYLVVYDGAIIAEGYSERYCEPMPTMSSVKSITALLVGMLIDDGKLASVDEPVGKFIPEWNDDARRSVTIRHLLTMTSGLKRLYEPTGPEHSVGFVEDKNSYVISLRPTYKAGEKWEYSNEGVQLLSPILDKVAGEPIQDYARKRLFEPIGMMHTEMRTDVAGHAWTYADAKTTLRDFARIGLLMMNDGKWGNKQIVPDSWVHQCLKPTAANQSYGYLWWLTESPSSFGTRGFCNTDIYCFPQAKLEVVRMQLGPNQSDDYMPKAMQLFKQLVILKPLSDQK